MSRLRLFRVRARGSVVPLPSTPIGMERRLHQLMERNLVAVLGVRCLATEYQTGRHSGRNDTLGLDPQHRPVIVEYKRGMASNLLSQGLYYLDWVEDHHAEFRQLVDDRLGLRAATAINWFGCRLICVAGAFSRYDVHAVRQIGRPIELVRYQWFREGLLLLESVTMSTARRTARKRKA